MGGVEEEVARRGLLARHPGLRRVRGLLASADSMAWSFDARRTDPLPGHTHKSCANCLEYALRWREHALVAAGVEEGDW